MVASFTGRPGSRARRNPHFRRMVGRGPTRRLPGSDRRRPVDNGKKRAQQREVTAVQHGEADLMRSPPSEAEWTSWRLAMRLRYKTFLADQTYGIFLNTRLPPFDSRAVTAGLQLCDRPQQGHSPGSAVRPERLSRARSCLSERPAYRPYCPYTRNTTRAGTWNGPDLARANKLVDASGTRGQHVVLWTGGKPFPTPSPSWPSR